MALVAPSEHQHGRVLSRHLAAKAKHRPAFSLQKLRLISTYESIVFVRSPKQTHSISRLITYWKGEPAS